VQGAHVGIALVAGEHRKDGGVQDVAVARRQRPCHALGLGRESPGAVRALRAQGFLANLLQAAPFKITPILTDNG